MDFTNANGNTIHYDYTAARNGYPLVFINALGTDLRIWDDTIPHLADRQPVLRFDKRGHGLSDCPPAPYSIRDHALDLLELLKNLGLAPAVLVGISVGGLIAIDFAAAWPERVHSLVLCDTAAQIGTPEMWAERIKALRENGLASMGDAILARWFAPSFMIESPAAYHGYLNMLTRNPLEGYIGTCQALRDADLTAAAQKIAAPTLILCGAQDVSTPPEVARKLVELIPNAAFHEIPGAAHLSCVEAPGAVAVHIENFL